MEAHKFVALKANPNVESFSPGDTVKVSMRIKEGDRERVQAFQGVVIAIRKAGPATSFTVRRVTYGVGVERSFPLYSPLLEKVEVVRRGSVRRGKLFYLRGLSGKAARLKERSSTQRRGLEITQSLQQEEPAPPSTEPGPAPQSGPEAAPQAEEQQPQQQG